MTVCVVLCVSPIVSSFCESGSESSSWRPHQLWHALRREASMWARRGESRSSHCLRVSVHVRYTGGSILPQPRHLAFVTSCNLLHHCLATETFTMFSWVWHLIMCLVWLWSQMSTSIVWVCKMQSEWVFPIIAANSTLIDQPHYLGVTLSTSSLVYK